ncbi:MAG: potassium channel family protein [Bacilli bacterium]
MINNSIFAKNIITNFSIFNVSKFSIFNCFINGDTLSFNNTKFICEDEISFEYVYLKNNEYSFTKVLFDSNKFIIKNHALVKDIDLFKLRFFDCNILANTEIYIENLKRLEIVKCVIEKTINIHKGAEEVSLHGTSILGNVLVLDYAKIVEAIELFYKNKDLEKSTMLACKMNEHLLLSQVYKTLGQIDNEDKAYVKYMNNCLAYKKETRGLKRLFDSNYIFRRITGILGKYGTSPTQVLFSSIIIVITMGLVYKILFSVLEVPITLIKAIYFSAVTFLTIGAGDIIINSSVVIALTVAEAFIGISMMSFFMVSLVRKVLR